MSMLTRNWRVIFLVDLLLKFVLLYGGAILASLGTIILGGLEGVIHFIIASAALAALNVVFLMVGERLVSSLRCVHLEEHPASRAALAVLCGLGLFGTTIASLFSLGAGVVAGAEMGLFLVVSNSISIAIAIFFCCTIRGVARILGW